MESAGGASAPSGGGGFSGVGDPSGFANAAPPPAPGFGGKSGGGNGVGKGHFPLSTYATFETGALAKVEGKIRELDAEMADGQKVGRDELLNW